MPISTCFASNCISWILKSHICSVRMKFVPRRLPPGTASALEETIGLMLLRLTGRFRRMSAAFLVGTMTET